MTTDLVSLAFIALIAAICPLVSQSLPHKPIPETVLLLLMGSVFGPYLLNIVQVTDAVDLLSDLGLAFLFLLAGYEINPKNLTGNQGRRGLITWFICLALAFLAVSFLTDLSTNSINGIAVAIALTTTALGTLMPILKERGLLNTRVDDSILAYGAWGELCPVLAMAFLLSTRTKWETALILLMFALICIIMAVAPGKTKKVGAKVFHLLVVNANTTSQTIIRITVLLLVGLIALSAVFDLDIVLGAFAAGFVLHHIIPEGNEGLEHKLDGIAYGFLIPVFFVVSGAKINLAAVATQPVLLIGFILALLLIRAVPIYVALSTGKDTRDISPRNRLTVAIYCTTALPVIVAVTSVAVSSGTMTQETASVLVAAGAITVFLMPLLGSLTYRMADIQPIEAVREMRANPHNIGTIVKNHLTRNRAPVEQDVRPRGSTESQTEVDETGEDASRIENSGDDR